MKVAVCISGQMRNIEKTFENISTNILIPNNADVFIHSWYDPQSPYIESIDMNRCKPIDINIPQRILDLYKPCKYLFEKPKDFSKSYDSILKVPEQWINTFLNQHPSKEHAKRHMIKNMKSMIYSIHKANELKELYAEEQGFMYDYIIRIRFDISLNKPLILNQMNLNPKSFYYVNLNQPDELISDWLNIGSNTVMNCMASMFYLFEYYNNFDYLKKEHRKPITFRSDNESIWGYEYFLRDLMNQLKIPCEKLNIYIKIVYE